LLLVVSVIACGALANDLIALDRERSWGITVHPLPPYLHNHPGQIAHRVEELVDRLEPPVAIAYSDCGTYGALDELCRRRGLSRLGGQHCYDVYAGSGQIEQIMTTEPGTYLLTDFLVKGFHRTVIVELGLDRYPDLRGDYFGNYRQVVWLATHPDDPDLAACALEAADALGLPLVVTPVGRDGLAREVETLLARTRLPR
jgi:hypothetical protein